MKKTFIKTLMAFTVLFAMLLTTIPVYASTMSMSTDKTTYIGKTITVNVSISADNPTLQSVQFTMEFNPDSFQFVSGNIYEASKSGLSGEEIKLTSSGKVTAYAFGYSITSKRIASLKFKAIGANESAVFKLTGLTLESESGEAIAPTAQQRDGISVVVTEPPVLSKNADLKSLTIAPGPLSPAFSSDNNSYSVTVGETTKSLAVDAQAADAKAKKVDISGHTNLKPGLNTVRIVVTAESGATKTYTIKVTRTEAAPTPAATPTPAPSPTPVPSPTPAPTVQINGTTLTIAPLVEGTTPPAGFSEASINVEGQTLPAYVSQSGGITLVYLANSAGTTAYYVYDAAAGSFAPYRSITIPARSYVLLPADDLTAPAGYKAATVTISGQTINGFQAEKADAANGQAILVYLMSDSGTKQLYAWNEKAGELSRFVPPVPEGNSPTPAPSGEPTGAVAGPVGNDNDPGNTGGTGNTGNGMFGLILVIVGLAALSVMLGGILLYQRFAGRRRKGYGRMQTPPIRRVDETLN